MRARARVRTTLGTACATPSSTLAHIAARIIVLLLLV